MPIPVRKYGKPLPTEIWPEVTSSINPVQQVLGEHGLGDAMFVIARKKSCGRPMGTGEK